MPNTFRPDALPPEDALERLREGNKRFVNGEQSSFRAWHPGLTEGQAPFGIVLGCIDSRAPAEYVFDQSLGDLFVIRVAGNIVAPSLVGSIEMATSLAGCRLCVVMGHTQCGAVRATVDALEHGDLTSANQMSIVKRITPHVKHLFVESDEGPGSSERDRRLRLAVEENAKASARELKNASPILEDLVSKGRLMIVASVYDLATGVVTFLDT